MNVWTKVIRREENKNWKILGNWDEDASFLVIEMRKSNLKRLMLQTTYERKDCYPYMLPVYRMPGEMR